MVKVLIVDAELSGISGDGFVGALIDAGAEAYGVVKVANAIRSLVPACGDIRVEVEDVLKKDVRAKRVKVNVQRDVKVESPQMLKELIVKTMEKLNSSKEAFNYALRVTDLLIGSEAKIHGTGDLKLHELGSLDTVIDITAAALALDCLRVFNQTRVYVLPVAVGGGFVELGGGRFKVPAPATLEILKACGIPFFGGPLNVELTTPTGAALLGGLNPQPVRFYPLMKPLSVGYGAGAKDLDEQPNVVRVVLGEVDEGLKGESLCVIETHVDDVNGESLGYTVRRLLAEGAKDAYIIPTLAKKGRPGHVVKVVSSPSDAARLAKVLMEETGTLGVRVLPLSRLFLRRELKRVKLELQGWSGEVTFKVVRGANGEVLRIKPEVEDLERIAKTLRKPLRLIAKEVEKAILEKLKQ